MRLTVPATASDPPAPVARPGVVLLVVAAAVFLASLDLFIVNVAFPDIEQRFAGSSIGTLSWVLNGYAIVFAALLVPTGRIADRVGRRAVFLAGLLVFVLASAACAAAWSVAALVAFRAVQATGAALLMATSLALLLDAFPPERRAGAIGAWAAVGGVAAALGPPLGGLLVELSWRWVFLVNLPVGIAALVVGLRVLRESRDEHDRRWPDALGTGLLLAGVAAVAWALVEAPDHGWGSGRTLIVLAAGVVALVLVVVRSATVGERRVPVVDLEMLRVRPFALASLAALLFTAAFAAMLLGLVLLLTGPWRMSVLTAGLAIAPGPLMAAAFAVPSGRLAQRHGAGPVAIAGAATFAVGCGWWLWRAGLEPDYAAAVLPGMLLTGIGVGLFLPSVSTAVATTLPPQRLATGSAVLSAARQLGAVLGVAILVGIYGHPAPGELLDAFRGGWTLMVVAAALAALVATGIGRARHAAVVPAERHTPAVSSSGA
ncbi:MFS transporter [Patulibacter defluvii]|uniref:MFS transporter n=1 Tax=Patulibacter defluvii TaxID=3095358 RepID=UPI002A74823E|nr:MFS transporter [Patulibacter sp. DM4]